MATSCGELTHWKRVWRWEGLGAEGEGDDRGWDGWMALPTRWMWVWVNSGRWWWTGRPGCAAIHGVVKSRTWLIDWTELNWAAYKGTLILLLDDCSAELLQAKRKCHDIFKISKKKKIELRLFYPASLWFGIKRERNNFIDKQKLKESIITKLALKEMLKGLLYAENRKAINRKKKKKRKEKRMDEREISPVQ